ncbi:protein SODIUM POTASSIUM ROOT DEFECTIVE 2-like isoform X2 [Juglans microcarpa x Juglans regia]|uniref:protein SODIUM POTASSIUM ROOT DEFECTIVE 2-like isoform X2 n=1 Tax=Juglans microcarpa x Juglans regia TaxID=2249226 RepID=UPI001B7EC472|nr:protein SODIUM POTASSIUM ROOT DEFECTIVE 2-like isoform X2 [Juglans microcarpa x Juglans regia]
MKRRDIFCASQASTAICLSMEQASSCSSSSTIKLGGRAIDRHNPIIGDSRRSARAFSAPCASQLPPINPKPYHQLQNQKTKKISSSKPRDQRTKISSKTSTDQKKKNTVTTPNDHLINKNSHLQAADIVRKIWGKQDDLISTPPASSRYLLSDTAYFDGLSDYDPVFSLVPVAQKTKTQAVNDQDESSVSKPASSSSRPKSPSSDQVVVLRVSLHCKGCEGKLRKHLSRMEGVTSFNIDFAAKKVTIMGDVTPLGVLESVSKVKNAQFWPAAISSTAAAAEDGSTNVEIKKGFT